MHQIALAKRPPPYYAWCSAGTSTQDVVDFDLQEETGSPPGGNADPGRRPEGNTQRVIAKPARRSSIARKRPVPAKTRCWHSQRQDFDRRPFHATHERFRRPTTPPRRTLLAGETGSAMTTTDPRFAQYKVIRRNGAVVGFEPAKITIAMTKAFLAVNGGQGAASARVRDEVTKLTDAVVAALMKRKPEGGAIHIEEIQDQVELALMRGGEHEVARAYVLYREKRSQERAHEKAAEARQGREHVDQRHRERRAQAARPRAADRARQGVVRRPGRRRARAASSRRRSRTSTTASRWRKCASAWCWRRAR